MPTTAFSQPLAVRLVASGGVPVVCVNASGQVIGAPTTIISTPTPVIQTDVNGAVAATGNVYSMPLNVTLASTGMYVQVVDPVTGVPTGLALV